MSRTLLRALLIGLAAAMLAGLAFAQTPDEIRERGVIRIATANEIPYGWVDENGVARGIAPETAIAVLEDMGITNIEWIVTDFGSLIPGLIAGRFDIVAASMAILPARCQQVIYADVNSSYGEGLLVQEGNPNDIHSYQDFVDDPSLKFGLVSGADQIDFAHAMGIPDSQIVSIASNTDALSAVATDRVDGYAATGLTVARLAQEGEGVEAADQFEDPVVDGTPVRSWGSFNFNQDATELRDAYNESLQAFQETQEWRDILMSHGLSEADIESTLNASTEELCSE
ncbi:MAG TPA: ectoine/hydroxyectoine ABC transporter substrate-binding protein EhuB [Trueperaceae bacterium]|nr:ectoine/hydroxyectoine ABC transporter substrate-binding protein EhuB [Trueperaceae bacterium]